MCDDCLNWWLVGFTDGEGCFSITMAKASGQLFARYSLQVSEKYKEGLEGARDLLGGVGTIITAPPKPPRQRKYIYTVQRVQNLVDTIIPFFDKHPLMTRKRRDYELWKEAVCIIHRKEHLTEAGRRRIVEIREVINK